MPGTSANVFIWNREGPPGAKGHFKDYEVGADCIALDCAMFVGRRGV